MAKLQEFNGFTQVNLHASVGENGVNAKNDVIAVQALMRYGLNWRRSWADVELPEPNGVMGPKTAALIRRFQQELRKSAGRGVIVDGRIDPAKGIRPSGRRAMWTILMLNTAAVETFLLKGAEGVSYIHEISKQYPAFKAAIGSNGVGTLDLELEGSAPGIGTLGLSLE
ncbi:MAG: hypothetical protein KF762_17060 [Acidobacteria bacterium]|nr:hypothetical protein [Acidobacteriota bacterium]